MKPTKNKIFCKDANRTKMLFETEKKANTFIKFNKEEIEIESGKSPIRSYYCISCDGWHTTSKTENTNVKSKTEKILELYDEHKEKRKLEIKENAEKKKNREENLIKQIEGIEEKIKIIETIDVNNNTFDRTEILSNAIIEFEIVKKYFGNKKKRQAIADKLNTLKTMYN